MCTTKVGNYTAGVYASIKCELWIWQQKKTLLLQSWRAKRQVKGQYDYEGENTEKHNFLVQINMKLEKLTEWLKVDLLISKCLRYNRNYQKIW